MNSEVPHSSRFTLHLFTILTFYAKMLYMNIINIKDTSNKLFFIGGVVRDELLGRESFDIDITYVGNAIEYCSKFGEVIQVNPDFGTVRVKVKQHGIDPLPNFSLSHSDKDEIQPSPLEREEFIVDFASTRSESYPRKGHLPVVEKIGCTLKEDVMRRDFTINALAKSVKIKNFVFCMTTVLLTTRQELSERLNFRYVLDLTLMNIQGNFRKITLQILITI